MEAVRAFFLARCGISGPLLSICGEPGGLLLEWFTDESAVLRRATSLADRRDHDRRRTAGTTTPTVLGGAGGEGIAASPVRAAAAAAAAVRERVGGLTIYLIIL